MPGQADLSLAWLPEKNRACCCRPGFFISRLLKNYCACQYFVENSLKMLIYTG